MKKDTKKVVKYALIVSTTVVILYFVFQLVYFELFKSCGNCTPPPAIQLTEQNNGQTLAAKSGDTVTVSLNNTYWQFEPIQAAGVIIQLYPPVADPDRSSDRVPGTGKGTVTAQYRAVTPGVATISASRTICGEAMLCPPDQKKYQVTLQITD